ncbi:MAG: OmpA family protein, partial [Spirochaetaceae bacterium]
SAAERREEGAEPEPADPEPATPSPREWTVYFRPDSPELTEPTREELAGIAEELAAAEETAESNTEREVDIVGHTALAGTEQGRYGLSRERARNVYEYLLSEGWEPAGEVAVRGVGGEEPVTRDPDEQQRNRRVEISLRPR